MIRPILLYGDPVLRMVSEPLEKDSKLDLKALINDMFETMHKAQGIGLSAIQIGIPLRIFVSECHSEEENFHFRGVFINPKIVDESGSSKFSEGCLSVPHLAALLERPEKIKLQWLDENWEEREEEFSGFAARIIQHEMDHLEGKIFTDKLDKMWGSTLKKPLKEIEDRVIDVPYLYK
jgi:peptide deformylase